jgi:hypothetical protein
MRSRKRAWSLLTDTLHATLAALAPGQFLIISHRDTNRYVQFACERRGQLEMEAASNHYIEPLPYVLTKADFAALKRLGWRAPNILPPETYPHGPPNGSSNFWARTINRRNWAPIAERAVRTFRDVYRIEHPRELDYHAFYEDITIYFPMLGLYPRVPEIGAPIDDPSHERHSDREGDDQVGGDEGWRCPW